MPRGRPKGSKNKVSMNLNLPAGGTRFLNTKKRIAAKTAAYAAFSPAQMSGRNTMAALFPYGTSSKSYKGKKVKQPASLKQLEALVKARAARAGRRSGASPGSAVAVGDAAGRGLIGGIMSALGNFV
jgi:hypothetical protein